LQVSAGKEASLGKGAPHDERLFGLQIPTAFLDKVFIGHLHGDHFGGIGALYVAGGIAGRFSPLRIWGPSGSTPELGTKAAIDHMEKMYAWDLAGRLGQTDVRGFATEVTEFDYKKAQVVYEENGVKITAFPATMRSMAQSATGWTGTGCRLFSPATPTRTSGSWSRPRTRTSWFMNASSPSRTLWPSMG